jgi:hypothetical protein
VFYPGGRRSLYFRRHSVHHEMESERPSQKYGFVFDEVIPKMNRVGFPMADQPLPDTWVRWFDGAVVFLLFKVLDAGLKRSPLRLDDGRLESSVVDEAVSSRTEFAI